MNTVDVLGSFLCHYCFIYYMNYSVGFCSKQASVTIAKPGFTHMWQTLEVSSTLVIPVMLHSHPLYD